MNSELQKLQDVWLLSRTKRTTSIPNFSFSELVNSIVSTGPFYFYIIDFFDMSVSNASASIFDIHGLDSQNVTLNEILATIHPDDLDFVANAEAFITYFFKEKLQKEKLLNYKMSYCFRSRLANGKYVLINHQALLLTIDDDGRSGKSLNIHTRVDHLSSTNNYKISLIGLNGEPSFMNMSLIDDIQTITQFSKREIDILKSMADGLTSMEIAEKLFISESTVKTHRKNILEKSGYKNTAQLITNCVRMNLI